MRARVVIALFAALFVLCFAMAARAHTAHGPKGEQVYESACCRSTKDAHGGDCHPLPEGAVRAEKNGWAITIRGPEDHPLATRRHEFFIPYDSKKVRPATDGRFHLCLWPTEADDKCFYAPPHGF